MCISAAAVMAISAGVSVAGQLAQGQAQKQAKDAQAHEYDIQAAQAKVDAEQEAKRIRAAGEKTAGAARAALAGAGINVDSGSAININEDIYRNSESDAFNTLLTGSNRAASYGRSASQSRGAGKDAESASLLSAATTAGNAYAGWKSARVPTTSDAFADRAGAIGSGSGGRMRTITGGR